MAGAAFALTADEPSSPRLDALKADPLAAHAPAGARPDAVHLTEEGSTLGKPRQAKLNRWFNVSEADARRRFDEAVDVARAAGWTLDAGSGGDAMVGAKQIAGGAAHAVIQLHSGASHLPEGVRPPALSISLGR